MRLCLLPHLLRCRYQGTLDTLDQLLNRAERATLGSLRRSCLLLVRLCTNLMPASFDHLAQRMNCNLKHCLCMVTDRLMVLDLLKGVSLAV